MISLVQSTLDSALYPDVLSYWQRKTGPDANEYIVYSRAGDHPESFADDTPLVKNAWITIQYYYRAEMITTQEGREIVKARESGILTALEGAGFVVPDGGFDVGDVDDIGYFVTVFECEYWRVV